MSTSLATYQLDSLHVVFCCMQLRPSWVLFCDQEMQAKVGEVVKFRPEFEYANRVLVGMESQSLIGSQEGPACDACLHGLGLSQKDTTMVANTYEFP